MPIRLELRPLYPPHWRELSRLVRFERARGRCQRCGRPHLARVRVLPDGRWFDEVSTTWRDCRGRSGRWPDLVEAIGLRTTRVVLAAAHLDSDRTNNRLANLRCLCQRCHMLHDRPHHLAQRWITYRRRGAVGDFFWPLRTAQTSSATPWLTGAGLPRSALGILRSQRLVEGCLSNLEPGRGVADGEWQAFLRKPLDADIMSRRCTRRRADQVLVTKRRRDVNWICFAVQLALPRHADIALAHWRT